MPASPAPVAASPRTLLPAFARRYAGRYLGVYALGVAMLLATNGLNVAIPHMIKEVFDALGAGQDVTQVHTWALLISLAATAVIVVRTLSRVLFFNPGRTIEYRLRNDMLSRLLSMSDNYFRRHALGDLVSRATNDATYVRALVGFSVLMLINLAMAAVLSLWQMMETNALLTLYCLVPLVGAVVLLRLGIGRLFAAMRAAQEELGALSEHVLETLSGIAVVQGAVATDAFERRFERHNLRYTQLNLQVTALRTFLLPLASAVGSFCIFLLLVVGGEHAVQGRMSIGDMAAYASYVVMLAGTLGAAGWLLNSLQRGYVSLQRCWEVVELRSDRPEGTVALAAQGPGLTVKLEGVVFRYADAADDERPALVDIDLELGPGEVLGIYGPVGSGKTTLVDLLAGLLPVTAGRICLDGHDIATLQPHSFRAVTAVVPQSAFLFSRSLRENVAFVEASDQIDDRRVEQALQKAALSDEVARFPQGVHTVVGERGLNLSGGQRQRAQLARAMYRPSRLLLLDDVLSAVDHDTEQRLLETIAGELGFGEGAPTAVIVSSRISALAGADQIVVLDGGRIVQRGDHASLVAQGGLYAEAWHAQREREEMQSPATQGGAG